MLPTVSEMLYAESVTERTILKHERALFPGETNLLEAAMCAHSKNGQRHLSSIMPSFETRNMFTYAKDTGDRYDANKRVKTKLGRLIRKRFPDTAYTDAMLARLCDAVLADPITQEHFDKYTPKNNDHLFRIVEGDDICTLYVKLSAKYPSGPLGGSCMRHSFELTKWYAMNPDKVKMVVMEDEEIQFAARALLWFCDDGEILVDRLYWSAGMAASVVEVQIEKYVSSRYPNKEIIFRWQHYSNSCPGDGERIVPYSLRCTLLWEKNTNMPYIDTIRFFEGEPYRQCHITLRNDPEEFDGDEDIYICNETCGGYERYSDGDSYVCENCGCRIREGDECWVQGDGYRECICDDCYTELAATCKCCGESYYVSAMVMDADISLCQSCYEENYIVCEDCDCLTLTDDAVLVSHDRYVCDSCSSSYYSCDECGELFDPGTMQHVGDNHLCATCVNDLCSPCDNCGEVCLRDEMEARDDELLCEDCWNAAVLLEEENEAALREEEENEVTDQPSAAVL